MDPRLTASEFVLALCLFREMRGESKAGKAAVLAVIRNRTVDSRHRWPKTTTGVILQPYQFSSFNSNDPNNRVFPDVASPGAWQAWLDCCDVVTTPLTADPTNGATNYEAMPPGTIRPTWADASKLTIEIGNTRFYRL